MLNVFAISMIIGIFKAVKWEALFLDMFNAGKLQQEQKYTCNGMCS